MFLDVFLLCVWTNVMYFNDYGVANLLQHLYIHKKKKKWTVLCRPRARCLCSRWNPEGYRDISQAGSFQPAVAQQHKTESFHCCASFNMKLVALKDFRRPRRLFDYFRERRGYFTCSVTSTSTGTSSVHVQVLQHWKVGKQRQRNQTKWVSAQRVPSGST